ncbi:MAG: hypothetical protein K0R00_2491 [Herbinix sp.]|nr:hypothetical protein [Herbinix sp.]
MVSDDKVRMLVTVPREMKKELDELAKKNIRNTSNYIVSILAAHLENEKKNSK